MHFIIRTQLTTPYMFIHLSTYVIEIAIFMMEKVYSSNVVYYVYGDNDISSSLDEFYNTIHVK